MSATGRLHRLGARLAARFETASVRTLGTSAVGLVYRTPVLALTTTGRRSGRRRMTVLAYVAQSDGWLVAGGAAGRARVDWIANLRADPSAEVVVRRRRVPVRAEELSGDVHAAARATVIARFPRIARYEARAGRPAPVFALRPAQPAEPSDQPGRSSPMVRNTSASHTRP